MPSSAREAVTVRRARAQSANGAASHLEWDGKLVGDFNPSQEYYIESSQPIIPSMVDNQ